MRAKGKLSVVNFVCSTFTTCDHEKLHKSVMCLGPRDVGDGWAGWAGWTGWAIVHPGFGWSVNPLISNQRGQVVPLTLLLAHPALGSFLRPCRLLCLGCLLDSATIKSLFIALYSLSLFIIYLFYLYSSTSGILGEIFDIFCNSRYIFEMSNFIKDL